MRLKPVVRKINPDGFGADGSVKPPRILRGNVVFICVIAAWRGRTKEKALVTLTRRRRNQFLFGLRDAAESEREGEKKRA